MFLPNCRMTPQSLVTLLTRYQNGSATDEERAQIEAWYENLDGPAESVLSATDKNAFIEKYWQELAPQISTEAPLRRLPTVFYRVAAAAVVLLVMGLGGYFFLNRSTSNQTELASHQSDEQIVSRTNKSNKPLRISLSEGSAVTLQPRSTVYYATTFVGRKREVRLNGEAFFEVAKNPDKPFLVYANGMVTKVLGTSFTIIGHAGKPTSEVVVRTGRVAVYRQTDTEDRESDVVLKPNEKATFFRSDSRIVKALADRPVVLKPEAIRTHFVFDDTPVARVFRELDDVYGVHISFDEQALVNCTLTANLANLSLPAQLDMICLSIGATYQTNGTRIRINSSGRGCS